MKQLIQNFKTGELKVDDVPPPIVHDNAILVQNYYSVISAGTERFTVSMGKSSLIGKAKQRPEQVKQILDTIKKEGLVSTYQKVQNKLDTPKALGYSSVGKVLAIGKNISNVSTGEIVACGGQDIASHAEQIVVPKNLYAKVPENVTMEEASFTTMGAIAMQGVRLCKPELGHKVAVIGMGILGHIATQLLSASGCEVIALDILEGSLKNSEKSGSNYSFKIDDNVIKNIENATDGYGVDSVLIMAGTSSNQPIELSGKICRKKGRVVVTGAVRMDIPREHFFKKEIEVVISCSYGPGRYDSFYEDHGFDYPYEFVRFTENRNFETFLSLLAQRKISLKHLITHRFDIDNAIHAYDLILGETDELYRGVLLKYDQNEKTLKTKVKLREPSELKKYNIGFLGAGSHAQSHLLPGVKSVSNTKLISVCTKTGANAKSIGERFGFDHCTSNPKDVIENEDINITIIATRHDSHANLVIECLQADKHIFVEKPLALNENELSNVITEFNKSTRHLMVGFNRRYSFLSEKLKSFFSTVEEPMCLNYRINAGFLPKDHWTQDPTYGGGRIIGEVCHFIDYAKFLTESKLTSVSASCINSNNTEITNEDTVAITLSYENGSIAQILYISNGDKSIAKERIEVSSGAQFAILDDFQELLLTKNGKQTKIKQRDKGQKKCIELFLNSVNSDTHLISFDDLVETTQATFDILKSIRNGTKVVCK